MIVYFKPSFVKDFSKLPYGIQREVRFICTDIFPRLRHVKDFAGYEVKPIQGFKDYFRIRLGDYRIGFKMTKNAVEFMRVKHRKDIYKHFP